MAAIDKYKAKASKHVNCIYHKDWELASVIHDMMGRMTENSNIDRKNLKDLINCACSSKKVYDMQSAISAIYFLSTFIY